MGMTGELSGRERIEDRKDQSYALVLAKAVH